MIVHEDAVTFVHSHPDRDLEPQTGELRFLGRLPKPGLYRAWLQFRRGGRVQTARVSNPRRGQSVKRTIAVSLACVIALIAHEGGMKNLKPTKAAADLKRAWERSRRRNGSSPRRAATRAASNLVQSLRAGQRLLQLRGERKGGPGRVRRMLRGVEVRARSDQGHRRQVGRAAHRGPPGLRPSAPARQIPPRRTCAPPPRRCSAPNARWWAKSDSPAASAAAAASARTRPPARAAPTWPARSAASAAIASTAGAPGCGAFAGISPDEVMIAGPEPDMDAMRYASGTSQQPAAAPMQMISRLLGGWTVMAGGQFFGVYSDQTGPRGRDKIFSTNWIMAMASHRAGPGTLTLRVMLSAEPATITGRRYPLLYATGETANGIPIINGQHPHDFFMELAASYKIRAGRAGRRSTSMADRAANRPWVRPRIRIAPRHRRIRWR